jgi:hypothetical protein
MQVEEELDIEVAATCSWSDTKTPTAQRENIIVLGCKVQ